MKKSMNFITLLKKTIGSRTKLLSFTHNFPDGNDTDH